MQNISVASLDRHAVHSTSKHSGPLNMLLFIYLLTSYSYLLILPSCCNYLLILVNYSSFYSFIYLSLFYLCSTICRL